MEVPATRKELDRKAHAEAIAAGAPQECGWLVEFPNGNPEPDSRADMYSIEECGAPVRYDAGGWSCTAGHDHREYGGIDHTEYFDADEIAGQFH